MLKRLSLAFLLMLVLADAALAARMLPVDENPYPGMTQVEAVRLVEVMQGQNAECRSRYDKGMVMDYLLTGKGYTFNTGISLQECVLRALGKPIGVGITREVPKEKPKFERKSPLVKPLTEEEVQAQELAKKRQEGMRIANMVRRSNTVCRRLYDEAQMADYYVFGTGTSAKERSLEECVNYGKSLLGVETGEIKPPTSERVLPGPNRPPIVLPGTLQEWQIARIVDAAMVARIGGKVCRNFYNRAEMTAALMENVIPPQQAELIKLGKNPDILDCVRYGLRISNINIH